MLADRTDIFSFMKNYKCYFWVIKLHTEIHILKPYE